MARMLPAALAIVLAVLLATATAGPASGAQNGDRDGVDSDEGADPGSRSGDAPETDTSDAAAEEDGLGFDSDEEEDEFGFDSDEEEDEFGFDSEDEEDEFGFDSDEEGFDYEAETGSETARWWDLDGSLGVSSSINFISHESATGTDFTGVSRLRLRLNLQLDIDLPREWDLRITPYIWYDFSYLINGRDNFTSQVLEAYEWEGDFQESYIEGPILENVDLKIGRQVVNWGRSDSLRVIDVLNPLDNREPGRADIEDLRWAIGMIRADWYPSSKWQLQAIAIPEMRFDDLPPVGSDFNPLTVEIPTEEPKSFEHWEFAGAVRGIFEGWDASLHYAWFYEDIPRLELTPAFTPVFRFNRLHMVGAGANYAWDAWLFKAELAGFEGFRYFADPGQDHWRLDAMAGVEYYGFNDHTLALEIVNRHVFDYDDSFRGGPDFVRENNTEYALRWTGDWLNARLQTTLLALMFGVDFRDGAVIRAQGSYTFRDGLVGTLGILLYEAGDLPPLSDWGRNDRVFIDLKWSF